VSEMKLTSGTNCSGLDMQPDLDRSSDIPCTGNNLVFIITLDLVFTYMLGKLSSVPCSMLLNVGP